jgi:hypothetical protein
MEVSVVGETPRLWGSGRGDPLDRDDGHSCGSTVPVPARLERCGRVGQGRVPGRRLVGLMSGYARRVTQPLRLVELGCVQTVLPELEPMARATRRSGCRLSELTSGGLSGWFIQSKLPGRKFQSHPGVPPARLIVLDVSLVPQNYCVDLQRVS